MNIMNDSPAINTSSILSPNHNPQHHQHHPSLYQTKPQQYQMNYTQSNHQMASAAVLSPTLQQQQHQKQMQMISTGGVQNKAPMQPTAYHQQVYAQPQTPVQPCPQPQQQQQSPGNLINSYTRSNSQQHLGSPSSQINSNAAIQHHLPIMIKQQPQSGQTVQLSPVISSQPVYSSQPASNYQTSPASYTTQANANRSYATQPTYSNQNNSNQYSPSPSTPTYSNYGQQPSSNPFFPQQAQPQQVQMAPSAQIPNVQMNYVNQPMQMQNRQANPQHQQVGQMFGQQPISLPTQQQQQTGAFNTNNLISYNSNENLMTNKAQVAQQPVQLVHSQLMSTQQPTQQGNQQHVASQSTPITPAKTTTSPAITPAKNTKKSKEKDKEKDSAKSALSNTSSNQSTSSTSLPSASSSTTVTTTTTTTTSSSTASSSVSTGSVQQGSATNGAVSNARGQRSAQHQLTVAQLLSQKHQQQQQQQSQNQQQPQSGKVNDSAPDQAASNRTLTSPLNVPTLQQASSNSALDSASGNNKTKQDEPASVGVNESLLSQDENSLSSSSSSLTLSLASKSDSLVNNKPPQTQSNQQQKPAIITKPSVMQASIQKIQTVTSNSAIQTTTTASTASAAAALFVRNVSTTPTNIQTITYQNTEAALNQESNSSFDQSSELNVKPATTEPLPDKKETQTVTSEPITSEQPPQTAHGCQDSNREIGRAHV